MATKLITVCPDCWKGVTQIEEKALDGTFALVWSTTAFGWVCESTGDEHRHEVVEVPEDEEPCAWCDTWNMDEEACFNAKDICTNCCDEAGGCCQEPA